MKVKKFYPVDMQMAQLGKAKWSVVRLIQLSKDFQVMEIPLDHLNVYHDYKSLSMRQMVMHMRAVLDADLSYPIILDEDGEVLDGRHRIMKAILEEAESIKAVRFEENPVPCEVVED